MYEVSGEIKKETRLDCVTPPNAQQTNENDATAT